MTEIINSNWQWLTDSVKRQGFTVIILLAAIWYIDNNNKIADARSQSCNEEIKQLLSDRNIEAQTVLINNTLAFEEMREALENLKNK